MTKPTIVTRAGKGSALTWTEGDANLTNLQDATITLTAGTGGTDVVSDLNGTVTLVAGTNITLTGDNTAKTITIDAAGGGGALDDLSDVTISMPSAGQILTYTMGGNWENQNAPSGGIASVSADTNPALGGNLDVADYSITNTITDGNVVITPNGSGSIVLDGQNWPQADGTSGQVLSTNGSGQLSWTSAGGGASNLSDLSDVAITSPDDNHVLVYNTTTSDWENTQLNLDLLSGVQISTPSSGQVLTYTMSGQWENQNAPSGGIASVSADTNPALGGNLDVADYSITNTITNGNVVITPNGTGKTKISAINYNEGSLYDLGTTGGTIAPDVANGNVQKITLNSALTLNAFTNPVAGQSLTLIIYGGTSYTSITSTMKFAGGTKTLTATAGCIDIVSIYYDGTNYFASLGKGFA